jgi:putative spermidine/putrescine transport system ATP-binding protein
MPMTDVLAEFREVSKTYDGASLVLENLSLSIRRGEFLTFLGPSGSGKTTALMLLAGFEQPTVGRILLEGNDISRLPPHRRGMGVVFQSYALFPHMSIRENIRFPLRIRAKTAVEREQLVDQALAMTKLERFADRKPGQLSGGQQQRAALARALVFKPPLVLLDEPLGALDKNLREEMQREIKALHRTLGVTMVYVTHDQTEALTMSDRVAVFARGRILQNASPRELYDNPADLFVAGFFGENNIIGCRVMGRSGLECSVQFMDGTVSTARCRQEHSIGDHVALCIRPEALTIGQRGTGPTCRATVIDAQYLGDHVRVRCAIGDDTPIVVRLDPRNGAAIPAAGEHLDLQWRTQDALVLPVNSSSPP